MLTGTKLLISKLTALWNKVEEYLYGCENIHDLKGKNHKGWNPIKNYSSKRKKKLLVIIN